MEYTPRYRQPFTLTEVRALDVPIITEEIARLQDSIRRLRDTQTALREITSSTPTGAVADPEYELAIKENDEVIDSQEERIVMLRLALSEKGISMEHHGAAVSESQLAPSEVVVGSLTNNRPRVEEASSENDATARIASIVAEVVRGTLATEQSTGDSSRASNIRKDALQKLATVCKEWDWGCERKVEDALAQYLHDISLWTHLSVRKPLTAMRTAPRPLDHDGHNQLSPSGADNLEELLQKLISMCKRVDRIHSHTFNSHCESAKAQPRKVTELEKIMLLTQMSEYERTHVSYGLPRPKGMSFSFNCNRPVLAREDISFKGFVHLELGFQKCIGSLMDDCLAQAHRGLRAAADNALGDRLQTVDIILATLAPYFVADNQKLPNR